MEEQATITPKKATRVRKTAPASTVTSDIQQTAPVAVSNQSTATKVFEDLIAKISLSKNEFDNLQKQIEQTKQEWVREQKQHQIEVSQQDTQQELERKREQETYQYSTNLARKRAEDEFQDKKTAWEKDLAQRKEELAKEKQELEQLRKSVADFDSQKEAAIKQAQTLLEKQLKEEYDHQTELREQQIKADKEVLGLKISNLEAENSRLNKDIEILKRSLDEATRQVKEIAVKVIESGSAQTKPQIAAE